MRARGSRCKTSKEPRVAPESGAALADEQSRVKRDESGTI